MEIIICCMIFFFFFSVCIAYWYVPMWRIGSKVLFGIVLGFILVTENGFHFAPTLFVIGVIIFLSEVYRAKYGDDVDSTIDDKEDEDDDVDSENKRYENDLIKLEEMLININRDIGKLNVNLKESKYKEIDRNIYKKLSAIKKLLKNNDELNYIKYNENRSWIKDRYSMIYDMVTYRIKKLPTPKFEVKRELDERKLKEKIKTRSGNIDSMLIKIFDDKEDGDR